MEVLTRKGRLRRACSLAIALTLLLAASACTDDDDDGGGDGSVPSGEESGAEATDDSAADTSGADATEPADDGTVTITAIDYAFEGVPESVPSGTVFTMVNESEAELHEMVAIRIPDEETRSVEEIAGLTEAEQDAIFGDAAPAFVMFQSPGDDEVIPALGDGTVTESGRYAMVCFIPVGVDPDEFLAAAEASPDGPPEIPGAGPPHVTEGMFAEFLVE